MQREAGRTNGNVWRTARGKAGERYGRDGNVGGTARDKAGIGYRAAPNPMNYAQRFPVRRNGKPDGKTGTLSEQRATKRENGTGATETSGEWRATKA